MSPFSNPPSAVKNLNPLRLNGRWLAVIITPPSNSWPSATQARNMAGVVARPQRATRPPAAATPAARAPSSMGPERRGSRPTAIRGENGAGEASPPLPLPRALSFFRQRNSTSPLPMKKATAGDRVSGWPSTPAMATPRMSEPFWRRW